MKKIFKILSICLVIIFLLNFITNYTYIRSSLWQYESGFRIGQGDFIEFGIDDNIYEICGNKIFYKNEYKADIVSISKFNSTFTIKSIKTNEIGVYTNTNEFLK